MRDLHFRVSKDNCTRVTNGKHFWRREGKRTKTGYSGHSHCGVYHNTLIAPPFNTSPHASFFCRGRLASMAPLPDGPRCKHRLSSFISISHHPSSSPSSKSCSSASPATSSRGEVSLINQRRRSSPLSAILFPLILFTAIELHKRQLLHSLSALLQSRLLPLTRSATISIDLANRSLLLSRKATRTMDHPHLLLACHRRFTRSSLAAR